MRKLLLTISVIIFITSVSFAQTQDSSIKEKKFVGTKKIEKAKENSITDVSKGESSKKHTKEIITIDAFSEAKNSKQVKKTK